MTFLVDRPLGGLAKWLRLCGFPATLAAFPAVAAQLPPPRPGTILLSRQQGFQGQPRPDLLVLAANDPFSQLTEVIRRLGLTRADLSPLSRCGDCDARLSVIPREEALGLVPEHVFHTQGEFSQCPRCRRLYWPGSHPARISARLDKIFPATEGPGAHTMPPREEGASHGD